MKLKSRVAGVLAALLAVGTLLPQAGATPFTETEFSWNTSATSVMNGTVLPMQVRINSNDTLGAAGTQDITAVVKTTKSQFTTVPNACGPGSSINAARDTLTCILPKVDFGTAVQFTANVTAGGVQDDTIVPTLTVNGDTKTLRPITINTVRGVELQSNYPTARQTVTVQTGTAVFAVPFTISVPKGGDLLGSPLSFTVRITDAGSPVPASTTLVPSTVLGQYTTTNEPAPCGYINSSIAYDDLPSVYGNGVDWNRFDCSMTATGTGQWRVNITNFNPSLGGRIGTNGVGQPTNRDDVVIINGSMLFTNNKPLFTGPDDIFNGTVTTSALTASTSAGVALVDGDATNQATTVNAIQPGTWTAGFSRGATIPNILSGQGTMWDAMGKVGLGTSFWFSVGDKTLSGGTPQTYTTAGDCIVWDSKGALARPDQTGGRSTTGTHWNWTGAGYHSEDIEYLYRATPITDVFAQSCGQLTGWSKTPPTEANREQVRGVRYLWRSVDENPTKDFQLVAWLTPQSSARPGDKIWAAGQRMRDGQWFDTRNNVPITPVSGQPYTGTNGGLDMVTVAGGSTYAKKSVSAPDPAKAGDTVSWTVTGGFTAMDSQTGQLTFTDKLPAGLELIPDTISGGGVWNAANRTLTWTIPSATSNRDYSFTYQTLLKSTTTQRNALLVETNAASVDPDARFSEASAASAVTPVSLGSTELTKTVASPEFAVNGSNAWLMTLRNADAPQAVWDVIDILPYDGDPNGSSFVGSITYGQLTTSDPNARIYWTTVAPETINPNPEDATNGSLGNPSAMWSTTKPAKPTGVRVTGLNLGSGDEVDMTLPFSVSKSAQLSKYANIAYAKATTTQLQMIRSASTALLVEGSQLQIDKDENIVRNYGPNGTITYDITVRNAGAGPANDVVVTDIPGDNLTSTVTFSNLSQGTASGNGWDVGVIPAGGLVTATVTATMTATPDYHVPSLNRIKVENPSNPAPNTCYVNLDVESDTDQCDYVRVDRKPNIDLLKRADKTTGLKAGDVVTYTFIATNTGQLPLSNVVVKEDNFSGSGTMSAITCPATTLAVGTSMNCTATYTVTQADVDKALPINNFASVKGTSPLGEEVNARDDEVINPIAQAPAITLTKTPDKSEHLKAGDVVTYTFVSKNTGNTTLYNVDIAEVTFSGNAPLSALNCETKTTLAPGETRTCTATYTLVQADIDESLPTVNVARTQGTSPLDVVVRDTDEVNVYPEAHDPAISLVKSVARSDRSGGSVDNLEVGDEVTYNFVGTNTGNVTLHNVKVTDTGFTGAGELRDFQCEDTTTLAPGASINCTALYTVTQADVDAQKAIDNTADIVGLSPEDVKVTDDDAVAINVVEADPAISLTKTPDKNAGLVKGDVVTYTFVATNTSLVTLYDVAISETEFDGTEQMTALDCTESTTLAPGESMTCTATYKVVQTDVDEQDSITNKARVDGHDVLDRKVSDTADAVVDPKAEEPSISLTKTPDKTSGLRVGDEVVYTFVATNTSEVTLYDVTIAETEFTGAGEMSALECKDKTTLAPGETVECKATYKLLQADIDAAKVIDNSAEVTGHDLLDREVSATADAKVSPIVDGPAIMLTKTPDKTAGLVKGDVVTYTFVATNTGDQTLTDVAIAEGDFTGAGKLSALECEDKTTLAPGETVECKATYTVTQADVDADKDIDNTATVEGTSTNGTKVTDEDEAKVAPKPAAPSIGLTKTPDKDANLKAGDVVTYTFVATNTGDVTLNKVKVIEGKFTGLGTLSPLTCEDKTTLAPGETVKCTATYTITEADGYAAVSIFNDAKATGISPTDVVVSSTDDAKITPLIIKKPAEPDSGDDAAMTPLRGNGPASMAWLLIVGALSTAGGALLLRRRMTA